MNADEKKLERTIIEVRVIHHDVKRGMNKKWELIQPKLSEIKRLEKGLPVDEVRMTKIHSFLQEIEKQYESTN